MCKHHSRWLGCMSEHKKQGSGVNDMVMQKPEGRDVVSQVDVWKKMFQAKA